MSTIRELILSKSLEDGDCLRWTGGKTGTGHPQTRIDGRSVLVRRALWESEKGTIPSGAVLRVFCGASDCVSLDHIKLTTHKQIALDCGALGLMSGQKRSAKIAATKRAGHQAKLSDEAVRIIKSSNRTGVSLARQFGIAQATVSKIRLGKARRDFSSPMSAMCGALMKGAAQ